MTSNFSTAMGRAIALTRAADVMGATRAIQEALMGGAGTAAEPDEALHRITTGAPKPPSNAQQSRAASILQRAHKPLSETLRILKSGRARIIDLPTAPTPPVPTPAGAQFLSRALTTNSGSMRYKLYIPTPRDTPPAGLIIMLHGCKQNPDDFAVGTGMNEVADTKNFIVAYPQQESSANAAACWNWFVPAHQMRDRGEPALMAALTRALTTEFNIPAGKVFAAGLSAGGAMAAILAETYPELYAAVGIHSGLAYGSANDVMSAFAAMRGDRLVRARTTADATAPRMILFQGSKDSTVHPSNVEALMSRRSDASLQRVIDPAANHNGRNVNRQVFHNAAGVHVLEVWEIEETGHAWSGGNERGSFTDKAGPSASAEMVRFFLSS